MLSSLEIKNFKGIKSGTISNLAQVNILVGRNNSGKSTVLDALLLMRCAFASGGYDRRNGLAYILQRRVNRWSGGEVQFRNYRELYYMLNDQEHLQFQAIFPDGIEMTWEANPIQDDVRLTSAGKELYSGGFSKTLVEEGLGRSQSFGSVAPAIGQENARFFALTHLLDASTIRIGYLEVPWERITFDRRDRILRHKVNEIYNLDIENFSLMPFAEHNRLVALLPNHSVPVDWLGDGLRYALNILALGILLEGTILMVEELETHQHPESLKLLIQTLFELAKKQNLQLFLTTHSWELMTYALEAAEEKDVGLAMHHVRLNEKGEFDARSIPQPDAKLLLDIGHDIRLSDKYIGAR